MAPAPTSPLGGSETCVFVGPKSGKTWGATTYTFLQTDGGQALRNRHQGTHTRGEQGHPLGISADFDATTNVHQKDPVSQFMLREFGGTEAPDGTMTPGKNRLEVGGLPHTMVKGLGDTTEAGEELSPKQKAFLAKVDLAYQEMRATSERFQAAMAPNMPRLKEAEQLWFNSAIPLASKRLAAEKGLAKAQASIQKKYRRQHKGAAPEEVEAAVSADPEVVRLTEERDVALAASESVRLQVLGIVQDVFAPWTQRLQSEIDAKLAGVDPSAAAVNLDAKQSGLLVQHIEAASKRSTLIRILHKHRAAFPDLDPESAPESLGELKEHMLARATQIKTAKWAPGEVTAREELIRRLSQDPNAIFGEREYSKKSRTFIRKNTSGSSPISVMQYLEKGFVRHDAMDPQKAPGRSKQGAFNAEFIKCMMLHGFDTLAAWTTVDTMHFDFVEGFDAVVAGKNFAPKG